ncbi:GntT/GntP/DsdX family permease [Aristophania vespae]|uniref:GntT/GntP/DsdX family permease n=1 Tax=Aristophania vespae TaxID=2697033 RepID=UPI0023513217|nr:gluconate:H+ symporter [Aristophania vespae]UMM64442.1 High-affinity gluconate transporter [Aristophania vespae]
MSTFFAILLVTAAILALVIFISRFKINPFIVLFTVSIALALLAGMPAEKVVSSFEEGVGHVLGHVGPVIALGTMLGKMLTESGGADRIALTISQIAGKKRIDWAMMVIGLLVGLPVFFEIGFVLLIPLVYVLAARTETPLLRVALPMGAALSVTHGLLPPHPATLLALSAYNADMGKTIMFGILIGTPVAIIAGPLFGRFAAARVPLTGHNAMADLFVKSEPTKKLPGFFITVFTIMLPVILMLIGSTANLVSPPHSKINSTLHFIGNTDIALGVATILSFYVLGTARGFSRETILRFTNESLAPTALIMLLVGAGGGFGRVLIDSGVSHAITETALGYHMPLLILGWLLAVIVRLASGSATVATATAASIMGPILAHSTNVSPELMVIATGAGSVAFGPMNDAGFWQIKEYLGLTVTQTLKTWSVLETLIAVFGLIFCLLASLIIS